MDTLTQIFQMILSFSILGITIMLTAWFCRSLYRFLKKRSASYGRCPHCNYLLSYHHIKKNICWSCDRVLDIEKS